MAGNGHTHVSVSSVKFAKVACDFAKKDSKLTSPRSGKHDSLRLAHSGKKQHILLAGKKHPEKKRSRLCGQKDTTENDTAKCGWYGKTLVTPT